MVCWARGNEEAENRRDEDRVGREKTDEEKKRAQSSVSATGAEKDSTVHVCMFYFVIQGLPLNAKRGPKCCLIDGGTWHQNDCLTSSLYTEQTIPL